MAFQYFNNEQDRLLQFLVPEFFHRLFSLSIVTSYAVARLLFVFLTFVAFHFFLRRWFSPGESFTGVLILSGSMAVSFLMGDLQESAPLLMLLFVLGLWAIYDKNDQYFSLTLFLGGGLTNETMLVIPIAYFFYRLPSAKLTDTLKTGFRTILISLPAFLAQAILRYINRGLPQLGGAYHLPDNLAGIWENLTHSLDALFHGIYIYPFIIFSIFWIYAIFGYSKSPRFFRCAFWIVPFFIASNLITEIIRKSRQMIPLAFILIPMSLFFLFPEKATLPLPAD